MQLSAWNTCIQRIFLDLKCNNLLVNLRDPQRPICKGFFCTAEAILLHAFQSLEVEERSESLILWFSSSCFAMDHPETFFYSSLLPQPNQALKQQLIVYATREILEGRIPYPEQLRPRILSDVIQLLDQYPSLGLTRRRFQPEEPAVLVVRGTIPIFYTNRVYKIPVEIWVPHSYPTSPPRACVTLDDQNATAIKLRHPYVDARRGGLINVPHMLDWHSERTLVVLVTTMCECFSRDPPLRAGPGPPPLPPSPPQPQPQPPHVQERQRQELEEERHRQEQVMQRQEGGRQQQAQERRSSSLWYSLMRRLAFLCIVCMLFSITTCSWSTFTLAVLVLGFALLW
ncbi:protein ELC-like isoform X2 [Prunus dulcis]|uniref:protein ELC-like isoform X2 n=1 Tax=Prunus dulcis TaxID=3755 RepID=UPI0014820462|nr:protein ELC-like isoform X2 [Prunus dulcis]XP_034227433.1 protein ELC-like isoform X2 [Prunus dulcis]XP_034227434.1 protein ELC-like isoform X2 [Prunus dulcis]XP_034227435.1 protein ELC-like isoform X2 [Prunus dulcis]